MIRQYQQISARLGTAVRAGGVDGRLLGEEQVGTIQRQVAVHFIGGHLMIPLDTVLTTGVQHDLCAQDIGLEEHLRVLDGTVHMALCGEVHHHVRMLFLKQVIDGPTVTDVRFHEAEVGVLHDALQRGQIAGIGQFVHTDDTIFRVPVQHIENKIAADKSGTAGDDDGHRISSFAIACKYCPYSVFINGFANSRSCSRPINPRR